jgi:xeroderma pigmentosum group C-complementing protein
MPRNIEDFKGHPIYILERHLHRDEIIYPKREVGKVNTGPKSNINAKMESVYRRQNVHIVKSMDKWFRLGRQVKSGEMALKRVAPRVQQRAKNEEDDLGHESNADTEVVGLYAAYQTELYIPPAVRNGRIPKNQFGNIDIYVRSMIPQGAVQIKSQYARQSARILGIDFADAVTGFRFKGRHGTAIIEGVVVAKDYKEAMLATLDGMSYAREQAIEEQRTSEALALWKRFLVGLRIIERVKTYKREDEDSDEGEEGDAMIQKFEKEMQSYKSGHFQYSDIDEVEVIEAPSVQTSSQTSTNSSQIKEKKLKGKVEEGLKEAKKDEAQIELEMMDEVMQIAEDESESDRMLIEEQHERQSVDKAAHNEDHEEAADKGWEQQSIIMSEDPEDEDAEPEWLD